ncbi:MAG TPA: hypothetical protein VIS99_13760 [Terrimicrobiaceae bacterium]
MTSLQSSWTSLYLLALDLSLKSFNFFDWRGFDTNPDRQQLPRLSQKWQKMFPFVKGTEYSGNNLSPS